MDWSKSKTLVCTNVTQLGFYQHGMVYNTSSPLGFWVTSPQLLPDSATLEYSPTGAVHHIATVYAKPLLDSQGGRIGVIGVHMELYNLNGYLEGIAPDSADNDGRGAAYITDGAGYMLATSNTKQATQREGIDNDDVTTKLTLAAESNFAVVRDAYRSGNRTSVFKVGGSLRTPPPPTVDPTHHLLWALDTTYCGP